MRKALRELLENEPDLTVSWEAESVESALVQMQTLAPDLILTDLSLPGASGLELVQTLRRVRPELRCLVVTGFDNSLYRTSALAVGAAGFVTKDDPAEVLSAVRCVLDSV